jgi:hypothetical protein
LFNCDAVLRFTLDRADCSCRLLSMRESAPPRRLERASPADDIFMIARGGAIANRIASIENENRSLLRFHVSHGRSLSAATPARLKCTVRTTASRYQQDDTITGFSNPRCMQRARLHHRSSVREPAAAAIARQPGERLICAGRRLLRTGGAA